MWSFLNMLNKNAGSNAVATAVYSIFGVIIVAALTNELPKVQSGIFFFVNCRAKNQSHEPFHISTQKRMMGTRMNAPHASVRQIQQRTVVFLLPSSGYLSQIINIRKFSEFFFRLKYKQSFTRTLVEFQELCTSTVVCFEMRYPSPIHKTQICSPTCQWLSFS